MAEPRAILSIEMTSNVSDLDLDRNLRATKERGTPMVKIGPIKSQPLIMCGSGPSLDDYFPAVRAMYPDAPIMAVNGAYAHLIEKHGQEPEYYAQLDGRDCNTNFVRCTSDRTTFLLASQVHPNIFERVPAERTIAFHINAPSAHAVFPGAGLYFGSGGGTIGSTAIAVAAVLGYRHICLLGYDSSYREGRAHVAYQPQNADYGTIPVFVGDKEYQTTPMMAKQVEEFRRYVRNLTQHFPDLDLRLFGQGLLYDYVIAGQTGEVTRESEAARYVEAYQDPTYGMSPHRAKVITDLLYYGEGSLLDVSTGRGETLRIADEIGYFPVKGTEAVPALCNERTTMALLPFLPFANEEFDTVTCFEVIEHLLPDDVIPALEELARVAKKRVIVSACITEDVRGGVNLHPSCRSEEAWVEAFRVAWGENAKITKIGDVSSNFVSPVYELLK